MENVVISQNAILCVDDEPIILISLKQELKKKLGNRFSYETAMNADEALEIIDELVSNGINLILILSDWLMPGIKGDEFLIIVHKKYPGIKSILITGHADEKAVARVKKEAGTYTVLSKPWDPNELLEAVKVCCGKY
jgi:DNA-binding NtrC family response regulator